jgi:hypothetical protein
MVSRKYVSVFDRIAQYNKTIDKFSESFKKMSKETMEKQFDRCIKDIESSTSSNSSNLSETSISLFTNNKKSNNVVYTGNYSSSMSRSSNTVNGITFGPSVF